MIFGLAWPLILELLLLGVFAGFVAGLLGIGGGLIIVVFMTVILSSHGMPSQHVVKIAIATSLATICFTSLSSVRSHHLRGAVRWDIVRLLVPGIVIGSLIGAQIVKALPARALTLVFAAFIGFSATQMVLDRKPKPSRTLPRLPGMAAAGTGIGMVSSLVGAGGGFISVPFMAWCNVPMLNAVATSAALGFPIAFAGTIGYVIAGWSLPGLPSATLGFVYLPALACIAIASVATAPVGAHVAHRLDVVLLKRIFAVMLYSVAAFMLYRSVVD
ncbi:MAG TPA: sulfite exporter TauE/SafE family protein [Caldimonas sp.]|nr:sulfite exporter TauE/SafE family protein [Caldimonas sp.]